MSSQTYYNAGARPGAGGLSSYRSWAHQNGQQATPSSFNSNWQISQAASLHGAAGHIPTSTIAQQPPSTFVSYANPTVPSYSSPDVASRIQMLQMQNRILQARQQNTMFKQALARSVIAHSNQSPVPYPVPYQQQSQPTNGVQNVFPQPMSQYPSVQSIFDSNNFVENLLPRQQQQFLPPPSAHQSQFAQMSQQPVAQQPQQPYSQQQQPQYHQSQEQQSQLLAQPQKQQHLRRPSKALGGERPNHSNASGHSSLPNGENDTPPPILENTDAVPAPVQATKPLNPLEDHTLKHPVAPLPASRQKLRFLTADIASQVETMKKTIEEDKVKHQSLAEQMQEKRRAAKQQVLASLRGSTAANGNNTTAPLPRLPRWRHVLAGHLRPTPDQLIRSKALFRAIVLSIVCLTIAPEKRLLKRKTQRRERAVRECNRTLRIFIEGIEDWMGKTILLPVSSIVTDGSLDFEPRLRKKISTSGFGGSSETAGGNASGVHHLPEKNLVPLKVRMRAITNALCQSTSPSSAVTGFLVSLIEDDNYFPRAFLFAGERQAVRLNVLGGTRGVVSAGITEKACLTVLGVSADSVETHRKYLRELTVELPAAVGDTEDTSNGGGSGATSALGDASGNGQGNASNLGGVSPRATALPRRGSVWATSNHNRPSHHPSTTTTTNTENQRSLHLHVHIQAVRLLLLNTVLVRILVHRLLLTPWHSKLCDPPVNQKVRRSTKNLRIVASLFYQLARRLNPLLPTREDVLLHHQQQQQHRPLPLTDHHSPGNQPNTTDHKNDGEDSNRGVGAEGDGEGEDKGASKRPTVHPVVLRLLRWTGFADTTPGFEAFAEDSLEHVLLAPRDIDEFNEAHHQGSGDLHSHVSISNGSASSEAPEENALVTSLMKFLLPRETLLPLEQALETEMDQWTAQLESWIETLTLHVLRAYVVKHHPRLFAHVPISVNGAVSADSGTTTASIAPFASNPGANATAASPVVAVQAGGERTGTARAGTVAASMGAVDMSVRNPSRRPGNVNSGSAR